ncbi:MAG TPA: hypothetical protein VMF06_01915 [Candidatus Limnocylindria bacterium]|jgi:hypothetical protein|nr:hypothetical protein [Candidatus Limnocylindria bacterium]
MNIETLNPEAPCSYARNTERLLTELIEHIRGDVDQVSDPKAKALFETSAEVLIGLRTAYQHYEKGAEKAFR